MNDGWNVFIYQWKEPFRRSMPAPAVIKQCIMCALVVGILPGLIDFVTGHGSRISLYFMIGMCIAVPCIVGLSALFYRSGSSASDSTLGLDEDLVKIGRYVVSETGRRYYCTWDSIRMTAVRYDDAHRVLQFEADWKVSAYAVKRGMFDRYVGPGRYIDSETRSYPQTFQLDLEHYKEALAYVCRYHKNILEKMTEEQYNEARPFIHKHHGT